MAGDLEPKANCTGRMETEVMQLKNRVKRIGKKRRDHFLEATVSQSFKVFAGKPLTIPVNSATAI